MNSNTTPKLIHPREKNLIQGHFFYTSQNLHYYLETRTPIGEFGVWEELLNGAKQREIKGS
jgi:hypothetical protein